MLEYSSSPPSPFVRPSPVVAVAGEPSASWRARKPSQSNGPQYTATATVLYAHELGLVPITTPAYSPQSNGPTEAFVKTFKRDYVDGAEVRDAEAVLAQLGGWIEDYNTRAPRSRCGARPTTGRQRL